MGLVMVEDWDLDEDTAPCPYCGEDVYEDAERCPNCGQYNSKEDAPPSAKPRWIVIGLVTFLVIAILWSLARG
jgi:predicted amidophosphoribosyltransferase